MSFASIDHAASMLLEARRSRGWLSSLPGDCRPDSVEQSYAIQQRVLEELGPIAAWKVGAARPDAEPACAAIAEATLFESGARLPAEMFHLVGIEAEIAYRLSGDLLPRDRPYGIDEVRASIGSIHPAIEVSDTRFVAWASQDRPSHVADQLNHGALVLGPALEDWSAVTPATQRTILSIDGTVKTEVVGGNPGGDPLRLLLWLANVGAPRFGGLRAGAVVTTGSVTGVDFVNAPVEAEVRLPGLGTVRVSVG